MCLPGLVMRGLRPLDVKGVHQSPQGGASGGHRPLDVRGSTRALREGFPEGQRLCDISQALVPDVLASLPLSLPPLSSLTRSGHFAVGLDRPNETEAGGR